LGNTCSWTMFAIKYQGLIVGIAAELFGGKRYPKWHMQCIWNMTCLIFGCGVHINNDQRVTGKLL
jgi:hypothetical protein